MIFLSLCVVIRLTFFFVGSLTTSCALLLRSYRQCVVESSKPDNQEDGDEDEAESQEARPKPSVWRPSLGQNKLETYVTEDIRVAVSCYLLFLRVILPCANSSHSCSACSVRLEC